MPRWLRWVGTGIVAVLALVVVAVAAVYLVTGRRFARRYEVRHAATALPAAPGDSARIERGRHIADAIGKCGECHGGDFGGKTMVDDAAFGRLAGPNLTSGRGGRGHYTDADWELAIRHGVARDGRPLLFMPSEAFQGMSDADLAALVAYLRTLPPVDREMPPSRPGPMARALYLGVGLPLVPAELVAHDAPHPASVEPAVDVDYGRYLASIGGCRSCHGQELRGDADPAAPDLTRTRLASWTEADFVRALRTGTRPDGTRIDPEKMPWVASGRMTDDEISAVWRYVRSVPPAPATQTAAR
jgi:cytochrome c553